MTSSLKSGPFPLSLFTDKSGLFYSSLAAATAAVVLLATLSRKPAIETKPRSGKMSPQDGTVKVSKILIHPIKSCRGTSVQSAKYTPQGLENDRRWCVIDATTFKVITAREVSKLVLITPYIQVDESSPDGGSLVVNFPKDSGCESFSVPLRPATGTLNSWEMLKNIVIWPGYEPLDGYICQSLLKGAPSPSEILTKFMGRPVHLTYKGPLPRAIDATHDFPDLKATTHFQDMYPLLILSEEGVQAVEQEIKPLIGTQGVEQRWEDAKMTAERFRPNIVLRGGGAFAEDNWEEMSIGSKDAPSITLVSKCTRCLLPNVDPETGVKDGAVPYKVIMKFRTGIDPVEKMKPCVGCNGVPQGEGVVKVGDDVYVKKMW